MLLDDPIVAANMNERGASNEEREREKKKRWTNQLATRT